MKEEESEEWGFQWSGETISEMESIKWNKMETELVTAWFSAVWLIIGPRAIETHGWP